MDLPVPKMGRADFSHLKINRRSSMKKATNQWCFPDDWSWIRVFELSQKSGFDGIELCIDYNPFFEATRKYGRPGLIL